MLIPSKSTATAAILLVAAGVVAWVAHGAAGALAPSPASVAASLSPAARSTLDRCREHAGMIQDVQWAAACVSHARTQEARRDACLRSAGTNGARDCDALLETADDSADCMLPMDRAATLNASLAAAENRCIEEARAEDGIFRTARAAWLRP